MTTSCVTAGVYYPCHEEYVGARPDMQGLCCRCGAVVDRVAGPKTLVFRQAVEAARRKWQGGEDLSDAERDLLGYR